jgi:ABC-type arginine transport system ATPase subunit
VTDLWRNTQAGKSSLCLGIIPRLPVPYDGLLRILGHSTEAFFTRITETVTGMRFALVGGLFQQFNCFPKIFVHAFAARVKIAQHIFALGVALIGGLLQPLCGFTGSFG